jgi:hypothetical protein
MISYLDYIKRLDELEIKLYDFQKRISLGKKPKLEHINPIETKRHF